MRACVLSSKVAQHSGGNAFSSGAPSEGFAQKKERKADLSLLPGPIQASRVEGKTLESAQASVLEIHPEPTLKSEVARSRLALKIKCGGDASGEVCRAGV